MLKAVVVLTVVTAVAYLLGRIVYDACHDDW
jgi:hypothetical protein